MSEPPRLDLSERRDLGAILGDTFRLVLRNARTFLAIALAVVVPVELIVSGVGLEQLWGEYRQDREPGELLVPFAVGYLVTGPLLAAMTIHAVLEAAEGRAPSARRSIEAGLEVFAPLFVAILLAAAGVAAGFVAFVVPGVFLAVRWYFVPQAVAIEGRRGPGALGRSWELVTGSWWRVFAITVVVSLAGGIPGAIAALPLTAVADATGRAAFELAGGIVAQTISGPIVAVAGTLLYFDLVNRRHGAGVPPPVVPPPSGGPR